MLYNSCFAYLFLVALLSVVLASYRSLSSVCPVKMLVRLLKQSLKSKSINIVCGTITCIREFRYIFFYNRSFLLGCIWHTGISINYVVFITSSYAHSALFLRVHRLHVHVLFFEYTYI
ncbi:hypothetical protein V1505DRAFT_14768 [Lipomyces doorenjongii]